MIREVAVLLFATCAAHQTATLGERDQTDVSGRLAVIPIATTAGLVVLGITAATIAVLILTVMAYNGATSRSDVKTLNEEERLEYGRGDGDETNAISRVLLREVRFVIHIERPHPTSAAALTVLVLLSGLTLLATAGVIRPHDPETINGLAMTFGGAGIVAALLAVITHFESKKTNRDD